MMRFVSVSLLVVLGLLGSAANCDCLASGMSQASSTSAKPPKNKAGSGPSKSLVITPEREAAAMTFVKQHHPELAELLRHLKQSSPKEYERAVRDLFRASERLAQVKERDSEAYELELKLWKARSRAQLLNARLHMSDDEQVLQQLREELATEYELRLQILKRERDKFADKVQNLDNQIERLTQRREEAIDSQLQQMVKASRAAEVKVKANAKKRNASKTDKTR